MSDTYIESILLLIPKQLEMHGCVFSTVAADALGPVLLQWTDAVTRIPANGSAAFNESCTPIG